MILRPLSVFWSSSFAILNARDTLANLRQKLRLTGDGTATPEPFTVCFRIPSHKSARQARPLNSWTNLDRATRLLWEFLRFFSDMLLREPHGFQCGSRC